MMTAKIDKIDLGILNCFTRNCSTPYRTLADQLDVSVGTIHTRIKKLTALGVIEGTFIQVNYAKLGYDITCFVGVHLEKSSWYDRVVSRLKRIPEIVNIHYTTGNYCIFLKLYCKNTRHLRDLLYEEIQNIDGVASTETLLSLNETLSRKLELV